MITDTCALVGKWPFAPLSYSSVDDLLVKMDKIGIARAVVSPVEGAFYKRPQPVNEALAAAIADHADRLLLAAVCNPSHLGWERDLQHAMSELGAVGVRLFPGYHGYGLEHPGTKALAIETAGQETPLFITVRLQDERYHPPAFKVPSVPLTSLITFANAHPQTHIVLSMARLPEIVLILNAVEHADFYSDIAGVQGPTQCIRKLISEVNGERLLFGTGMLLQYGLPARMKVDYADVTEQEKQAVFSCNWDKLSKGVY